MITYTDKLIPINLIQTESRIREQLDGTQKEESTIQSMMDSIKESGLMNPILVKPAGDNYILIAGFRRLTACKNLGWTEIRCSVTENDISDYTSKELEMIENLQRKQLEWWERDKGVELLHKMRVEKYGEKSINNPKGWDQSQTAELIGKQPSTVSQHLMVADMIKEFPDLAKLPSEAEALKFIRTAQEKFQQQWQAAKYIEEVNKSPVNIRKQTLINCFQVGDFFNLIHQVSDNSIDLLHIDPPFGVDINEQRSESEAHKAVQSSNYEEIPKDKYPEFLWNTLNLSLPKLKKTGWGILWFGWDWFELTRYYLSQIADLGIPIPGLWIKDRGQTKVPKRYLPRTLQPFWYFRPKDGEGKLNKNRVVGHYDYRILIAKHEKIHRTEMPLEMLTDIMSTFIPEGSNVLDCFAGSGNLGLACSNYNCKWIGFDLSQENKMFFEVKVHRDNFGEYSSYKYGKTEGEINDEDIIEN